MDQITQVASKWLTAGSVDSLDIGDRGWFSFPVGLRGMTGDFIKILRMANNLKCIIIYFWKFSLNIFWLGLTMGNWNQGKQNRRWGGTTALLPFFSGTRGTSAGKAVGELSGQNSIQHYQGSWPIPCFDHSFELLETLRDILPHRQKIKYCLLLFCKKYNWFQGIKEELS